MTDTAEPEVRTAGEPLLDLLNGFIVELREAGLPVSLTENLDAMAAIEHIPLEERETFKYALAATLVKNNAHWRSFETVFEVYFSLRGAKYGIDDDSLDPDLADLLDDDERDGEGEGGSGQSGQGGGDALTPEELQQRRGSPPPAAPASCATSRRVRSRRPRRVGTPGRAARSRPRTPSRTRANVSCS